MLFLVTNPPEKGGFDEKHSEWTRPPTVNHIL